MANTKITSNVISDDITLGGNPTTTTQSAGNDTTRIATTAFVQAAINATIDSAPGALNTLNELAAAIGDDANFSTTITNSIATKLPLAGGTMTGALKIGQNNVVINSSNLDDGSALGLQVTMPNADFSTDGGVGIGLGMDGRGRSYIVNTHSGTNRDSSLLSFWTENGGTISEAMRVTDAGNVLIGTTNTDIGGSVTGINLKETGAAMFSMDETGTYNQPLYADRRGTNNTGTVLAMGMGGYFKAAIDIHGTNSSTDDAAISFNTWSGNTTKTERMRVNAAGHVGIGTNDPYDSAWGSSSKQLTVSGTDYGVLNLIDTGGPTRFGIGAGDGKLYLAYDDVNSAHRIVVGASGAVGLGTTAPDSNSKLTITDGANPYAVANTLMQIKRNASNGSGNDDSARAGISLCNNSNGVQLAYGGTTDRFRILDGGLSEVFSLTNGGRVGINSTGGVGSLSVYGTVSSGDAHGDPDVTKSYGTNITAVNGSCIEIVSSIASSNTTPTCVITWNKGSWASFSYFFQYSGASYSGGRYGGGYHNNSDSSISGHSESGYGNDYLTITGSGQTLYFSFGFPQGYHPSIHAKFMGGGGMGSINANEFTVAWTT